MIQSRVLESAHLFSPLNLWESLFAARFGRLSTFFFFFFLTSAKSKFWRFSWHFFIPSVCQSVSQRPSCKSIKALYNLAFNKCLGGERYLTTPQRLEILMYASTKQQVTGECCLFATLGACFWLMPALQARCPQVWLVGNDLGKGWEWSRFQLAHTSVPVKSLLYSHTQTRYIV